MFFMMGITEGKKELQANCGMIICPECGSYASVRVFVTYMCLSIFFIPVFKWGKKYFAQSSCCNDFLSLAGEKGRALEKGEDVTITASDLTVLYQKNGTKNCRYCEYGVSSDFTSCPHCGNRL